MRAADRAWIVLGAGVVAYEATCSSDELLSVAVDRYLDRHPWLVRAVVTATALHLLNVIPSPADPWHTVWWLRKLTRRAAV